MLCNYLLQIKTFSRWSERDISGTLKKAEVPRVPSPGLHKQLTITCAQEHFDDTASHRLFKEPGDAASIVITMLRGFW